MKRKIRTISLLIMDTGVLAVSLLASYLLRFEFQIPVFINFSSKLVIIPLYIASMWIFRVYKTLWEYTSIQELIRIVLSILLPTSILLLINSVVEANYLPNSIVVLNFIISVAGISSFRVAYRILRIARSYGFVRNRDIENVLIVGAGRAGVTLLKEIRLNKSLNYNIVGFIDDSYDKYRKDINGIKVLGTVMEITTIAKNYNVSLIYIAIPSVNKRRLREIANICSETNSKIKLLPLIHDMAEDVNALSRAKDVKIEDLLGRDEVKLDNEKIFGFIEDKTVLVTGGGGSIGSEIVRQLINFRPRMIVVVDIYENNAYSLELEIRDKNKKSLCAPIEICVEIASVRDIGRLREVFTCYKPDVVFHAAAHKHVPLMEQSPKEAIKNNVFGTYNVVKVSEEFQVDRFVMISTDKAVNPTNIMGASKRYAEKIVQSFNNNSKTCFTLVRFGNVLGSNGSVIPYFKKQISNGGPVTVTHENIIRYFMTIPEAAQLVIQSGCFAGGGEVFVLDMGEPIRILDLAERMIRLSGFTPYDDIDIEITGLRPGEKMYEELLMVEEGLQKTANEKIFIGKIRTYERVYIENQLKEIEKSFKISNNDDFKKAFTKFVTSYRIEN